MTTLGRWDGNVHYYDGYTGTTAPRVPDEDAWVVAQAFIYDDTERSERHAVVVTMTVTGQDLRAAAMSLQMATDRARSLLSGLVERHRSEATGQLSTNRPYSYTWDGR
jgi:hypothetical protein